MKTAHFRQHFPNLFLYWRHFWKTSHMIGSSTFKAPSHLISPTSNPDKFKSNFIHLGKKMFKNALKLRYWLSRCWYKFYFYFILLWTKKRNKTLHRSCTDWCFQPLQTAVHHLALQTPHFPACEVPSTHFLSRTQKIPFHPKASIPPQLQLSGTKTLLTILQGPFLYLHLQNCQRSIF